MLIFFTTFGRKLFLAFLLFESRLNLLNTFSFLEDSHEPTLLS